MTRRTLLIRLQIGLALLAMILYFAFVLTRSRGDDIAGTGRVVTMRPPAVTLVVGDTARLRVTLADHRSCNCRWLSSDASVASVESTGLVRALSPGWSSIHAIEISHEDGKVLSLVEVRIR